ncbi:MAG: polyprenyl synthetase family protein [Candidatus Bathyarchaeia archaeon]
MASNSDPASKAKTPTQPSELMQEIAAAAQNVRRLIEKVLTSRRQPALLYEASRHLTQVGGKMLRPFLAMTACEAVGGRSEDAVPSAAALELMHTFTLVHDDIIDGDKFRRGVPTVHAQWDVPIAIIAGDLLFSKVFETVTAHTSRQRVEDARIVRVVREISEAAVTVCEGQVLDMTLPKIADATEDLYIEMVTRKTANLFAAASRVGGIIGGGGEGEIEALGNYGLDAGIAFQIVDDLLGLTAVEEELGKPLGSDLREGKRTLPYIHALEHASAAQRKQLTSYVGRDLTIQDVEEARKLMTSLGSLDHSRQIAEAYMNKSLQQLQRLPHSVARDRLAEIARLLVHRKH